jgi:23S rRNA pseudouridine2605 synthase
MAHDRTSAAPPLNANPSPEDPNSASSERLQKLLARAGYGSRRACEQLITAGRVTVDGRVASLGERADPAAQRIEVDGTPLSLPAIDLTLVLNKPVGYVVTASPEPGQRGVFELLPNAPPQLRYVGRLDEDTEGVLLFTTDGALVHRLTHPRYEVDKVYEAGVSGHPNEQALDTLRRGVQLEDGWTSPAQVAVLAESAGETVLRLVIHEGRKRQIRRMCRAVGHPVSRLRRVALGSIDLSGLEPGQSRRLTTEELANLYALTGLEAAVHRPG